jgi:hypothetical protein
LKRKLRDDDVSKVYKPPKWTYAVYLNVEVSKAPEVRRIDRLDVPKVHLRFCLLIYYRILKQKVQKVHPFAQLED